MLQEGIKQSDGQLQALAVNDSGELIIEGLADLNANLEALIALLPAALTTAGNLKVSIEEDNTAP